MPDVVIAGRGRCEVFTHLEASWSRVWLQELPDQQGHALRVRSQLADYGGDKAAQQADLEHTVGMISTLAEVKGHTAIAWLEAAKMVSEIAGAAHTPLRHEPR